MGSKRAVGKSKVSKRPRGARAGRPAKKAPAPGTRGRTRAQQAAVAEILHVIAASPAQVQPVLEAIAESVMRLLDCWGVIVTRFDGEQLHFGAARGARPDTEHYVRQRYPVRLSSETMSGRCILERAPVNVADMRAAADPRWREQARQRGYRAAMIVPMLSAARPVGAIGVSRREAGVFADGEVALLQTFADQAAIAIQNAQQFAQTAEALERQTAMAAILQVISSSPSDVQPVFDAIVRHATRLCRSEYSNVYRYDGENLHLAASAGATDEALAAVKKAYPRPPTMERVNGRVVLTGRIVRVEDTLQDTGVSQGIGASQGFRRILGVPLLRRDKAIGVIIIAWADPGPILPRYEELLKTFADQAAIAIENVRLFNETKEALERQTATAEILKVISESPTATQPVFDAIVSGAMRLFGGVSAAAAMVRGDRIELAAIAATPEGDRVRRLFPIPLDRESNTGRTILERRPTVVPDYSRAPELPAYAHELGRRGGIGAYLAAPMLREGTSIGAIVLFMAKPKAFDANEVAQLQTFADQAVIAIENVRLFTETKEALERQTATAEILKVISESPTDVQPVFDAIVRASVSLCDGRLSTVLRYDGEFLDIVAHHNLGAEGLAMYHRVYPARVSRDVVAGRAILDRAVINLPDSQADGVPAKSRALAIAAGFRSVLVVPILREGEPIGIVNVARAEAGPFSQAHVDLLQTFADQAVIAIENVRLFKELQSRTEALTQSVGQLTALGEVGQAISSTLDLDKVLPTIVARAVQLTGLDGGAIYEYDEQRRIFNLRGGENIVPELVELYRNEPIRLGEGAVGGAAAERAPVQVADILAQGYESRARGVLERAGARALLAVPLLREGRILGALAVIRNTPGEFPPEVVKLLETFGTQSAIAMQNARLFREIEEKGRELEIASQHKSQFLASMSHELRTPLNAILGFNEMILDEIYGEISADLRGPLENMQASGKHLLRLINNVLDLAKIEAGRMELALADYAVPDMVESVRSTLRPLAEAKGLAFNVAVPNDLPLAHGDAGRLTQCLMNLAGNALKFTKQGEVAVAVEAKGDALVFSVADTGIGIPPDKIDSLFTEFKQTDATIASEYGGSGLGLSITKKFIEMHGGRIWVESTPGEGSTFRFEVPVRAGQ